MPFARYVLEHSGKLAFPFRRYQIQKAWRGERPQEGRYREFTQADIDVVDVGELSPHFEAEMLLVIADVFSRFPVGDFVIQVNNRRIPNGFYQGIGLSDVTSTLRIADKLDKLGAEKVATSSSQAPPASRPDSASPWPPFARRISKPGSVCVSSASRTRCSKRGSSHLRGSSAPRWPTRPRVVDLRIARGLDYYTGTVYETQIIGNEDWGSVCPAGVMTPLRLRRPQHLSRRRNLIGVSRILGLLIDRASSRRLARPSPRSWWPF